MRLKISKKAKKISIRINNSGGCTVIVPYKRNKIIQEFLVRKAVSFYETSSTKINNAISKILIQNQNNKRKSVPTYKYSKEELKKKTYELVMQKINHYNSYYNFSYSKVFVKHMKTRWGSCSKIGNLNFNSKLCLLSEEEIGYVVVHELCHLKEFNHGNEFWKLVAETMPNFDSVRKGMKGIVL